MKLARLTAACASVLVVVAGCAGAEQTAAVAPPPTTLSEKALRSGGPSVRGGERTPLGQGLVLTVSAPKSFTPTGSASPPGAARAVGFDMTVENDGQTSYKPALLALEARSDGRATQQVIDTTAGYTGVAGGGELRPGESAHFSVAFAVPQGKAWVHIDARPDPSSSPAVTVFSETT
ncbi:hypothetical protein [Actinokineospora bangkokensis]|uniref:DUF4352 domain-containing protein n=1 Tax=Actinokineospora bangkokensis TaxID=1193682 RepID=A0A1Q9LBT0_9PSEU|nr:hypothetical protein [Actinokineospora bangkokensis]OLR89487.1 hypothetical protein BJP25_05215 [Actinokineospora bangkokensis]